MLQGNGIPRVAASAAFVLAHLLGAAGSADGQGSTTRPVVTAADYARAEQFLPGNAGRLLTGVPLGPVAWVADSDRFWYRVRTGDGERFILVDPAARTRRDAFDHGRLAAALSAAADTSYDPARMPFATFEFLDGGGALKLDIGAAKWRCDLADYTCTERGASTEFSAAELVSPDGTRALFTRDHNLRVRTAGEDEGVQLTDDGEPYWDYASSPEGNTSAVTIRRFGVPVPPAALWSPDGRYVATHQLDQRGVQEMHLVQGAPEDGSKRPRHHAYRYALPGDSIIPMAHMVIVDTEMGAVTRLNADPLNSIFQSPFTFQNVWWADDGSALYTLRFTRGQKAVSLEVADPATGEVRTIIEESCATYCEATPSLASRPNVRVLGGGDEVLWWSERDGWGHLYLYDGRSGDLQRQVTSGPWLVREVQHVDEETRTVWFTGSGREDGDPYYMQLYSVGLDGGAVRRLTPEDSHHLVTTSPGGAWFVDTHGRIDTAPVTVLRDRSGSVVMTLETGSLDGLEALGWSPPETVVTKARDGVTDLYGLIVKPTGFDPGATYPVIDFVYPGPQTAWVPKSVADPLSRVLWDAQATAELGAVVVVLDGLGKPLRSKAFHNFSYGNLQDAGGLADHVASMKQLAASRPWMDLDRVGVYGFSGGGYMSTHAILTQPDFYQVAVSGAGNHDQRGYIALWGELYHGLMDPDGANYIQQANTTHAANLKGKLLLIHGEMDDNVSPALTMQVVDALIKANRTFDMLILPNLNHGAGGDPYYIRRRWDYFVEHLIGAEPPADYRVVPS